MTPRKRTPRINPAARAAVSAHFSALRELRVADARLRQRAAVIEKAREG